MEELNKGQQIKVREYRNRRIGDFLKELHLTEGRCTGIPKIQRSMRDNGSPEARVERRARPSKAVQDTCQCNVDGVLGTNTVIAAIAVKKVAGTGLEREMSDAPAWSR
jgi:hypothetical protein